MQDPVGVVDLIDRGGTFCTKATSAGGVERGTLELSDFVGLFVDVGQKAAGGFAVEADGRDQTIMVLRYLRGPLVGIDLDHVIPRLRARMAAKRAIRGAFGEWRRLGNEAEAYGEAFDKTWRHS